LTLTVSVQVYCVNTYTACKRL